MRARSSFALLAVMVLCLAAAACSGGTDEPSVVNPTVGQVTVEATSAPTDRPAGEPADVPSEEPSSGSSATPSTVAPASPSSSPSAGPAPLTPPPVDDPDPASVSLGLEEVARLDAPIAMATRPGDLALYVAERAGRVRVIEPDGGVLDPIIDISGSVTTNSERGLLGLAWSADGQTLYLSSTDEEGASVLQAVDVVDGVLQARSLRTLLRVSQPASNHNGGDLHLAPDGYLWWSLGDGGAADDRFGNGQRPDTLLGTILRVQPTAEGYAIPPGNPWADGGEGAPEVWAYGLRNTWRFTFDEPTGTVWLADVGQNAAEEINRVEWTAAGLNYGWPRFEGDRRFDDEPVDGPVVEPIHTYDHGRGCSITGGRVYRGAELGSDMQGAYVYADFCDGRIFALDLAPDGSVEADVDTGLQVDSAVSFGTDPDGELYVLSLDGPIYRIVTT